jgi:hypothetical protein
VKVPSLALAIAAPLFLWGCPGDLHDPERFEGVLVCRSGIDVELIFSNRCGGSICHGGNSLDPAGGLDLTSPGLPQRLVGVAARECDGFLRVDPHDPDRSFLLGKLIDPPAGCGDRMPLVGMLSPAEIACVRAYVHSIAGQRFDAGPPAPTDGGADAAMPDAAVLDASMPDAAILDASMPDASDDLDASTPAPGDAG